MSQGPIAPRLDDPPPSYRRGVGVMVVNGDGLVFAAERLDTPGAWQMPQGGIDEGEDPFKAALRELEEETGIRSVHLLAESDGWLLYDLPPHLQGKVWKGRFIGQAQKWYALRFDGNDSEIRLDGAHAEFGAWQWLNAAALPDLIVGFKQPLYRAIVAEFAAVVAEQR